jgi:ubiquinone/menaquinone biosynthesis C-methylase UbiE
MWATFESHDDDQNSSWSPSQMTKWQPEIDIEASVRERYTAAAGKAEPALCCPVNYEAKYLEVLPEELIERDYGCGNPAEHIAEGETVLDLGSGGGKICYIASQIVGPEGQVIGVDQNDEMLALARRYQNQIGERIGWHNTQFFKGQIQDLSLDLERFEDYLQTEPVHNSNDWDRASRWADEQRLNHAMISNESIDVIVSNCVLNLVSPASREQLFSEVFRVLKAGGRAVISDIVSDQPVPAHLQNDPALWSGCISGAFVEQEFLQAFENAGFYGMEIITRQNEAWATVEGIEFRSMTVRAFKRKEGPRLDQHQAVIYNGPWKSVTDDDGHVLRRGERMSVCGKTFEIYIHSPYLEQITALPPVQEIPKTGAAPFDDDTSRLHDIRTTKGQSSKMTALPTGDRCGPQGDCC